MGRDRPCPFRRPSMAGGRPPRAGTLRPAEARARPSRNVHSRVNPRPESQRIAALSMAPAQHGNATLQAPALAPIEMHPCRSLRSVARGRAPTATHVHQARRCDGIRDRCQAPAAARCAGAGRDPGALEFAGPSIPASTERSCVGTERDPTVAAGLDHGLSLCRRSDRLVPAGADTVPQLVRLSSLDDVVAVAAEVEAGVSMGDYGKAARGWLLALGAGGRILEGLAGDPRCWRWGEREVGPGGASLSPTVSVAAQTSARAAWRSGLMRMTSQMRPVRSSRRMTSAEGSSSWRCSP